MNRLDGKVALITGAARGMGAEHAKVFAAEGAKVVLSDILDEEGRAVAAAIGESARYVHHDVRSADEWERAVAEATDAFGRLDVLVSNAGVGTYAPMDQMTEEQYRRDVDINQVGVFLGMKAVIAPMERAGGGSIINISSLAGLVGEVNLIAYTASKFAVTGMTKVAAKELGGRQIRVNSVHPGVITTPLVADEVPDAAVQQLIGMTALQRAGVPKDVSSMVLFLASDESSFVSGSQFVIDGGLMW